MEHHTSMQVDDTTVSCVNPMVSLRRAKNHARNPFRSSVHSLQRSFEFFLVDFRVDYGPKHLFKGVQTYDMARYVSRKGEFCPAEQHQIAAQCMAAVEPPPVAETKQPGQKAKSYYERNLFNKPAKKISNHGDNPFTALASHVTVVSLFGLDAHGNSVVVHVHDWRHSCFLRFDERYCDDSYCERMLQSFRNEHDLSPQQMSWCIERRYWAMGFVPDKANPRQPRRWRYHCIRFNTPEWCNRKTSVFQKWIQRQCDPECRARAVFDERPKVTPDQRFVAEHDVKPMRWVTIDHWREPDSFTTHTQIEIDCLAKNIRVQMREHTAPFLMVSWDLETCVSPNIGKDYAPGIEPPKIFLANMTVTRFQPDVWPAVCESDRAFHAPIREEFNQTLPPTEQFSPAYLAEQIAAGATQATGAVQKVVPSQHCINFQFMFDPALKSKQAKYHLDPLVPDQSGGLLVHVFQQERDMLLAIRDFMVQLQPDVILGHNAASYDWSVYMRRFSFLMNETPYIHALNPLPHQTEEEWRAARKPDMNMVRPTSSFWYHSKYIGRVRPLIYSAGSSDAKGLKQLCYPDLAGCGQMIVDSQFAIAEGFQKYDSYSLDFLSPLLLKDTKVDLPVTKLESMWYERRFLDMCHYCHYDCLLPLGLMDVTKFFETYIQLSRMSFALTSHLLTKGTQHQIWQKLSHTVHKAGAILNFMQYETPESYQAAIVFDPKPGLYRTHPVMVGDFAGLYPSQINAHNICPSTVLVELDDHLDPVTRSDGTFDTSIPHLADYYRALKPKLESIYGPAVPPQNVIDKNMEEEWRELLCITSAYTNEFVPGADFAHFPRVQFIRNDAFMQKDPNNFVGIIPRIQDELRDARATTRHEMESLKADGTVFNDALQKWLCPMSHALYSALNARQAAIKIVMNSIYGFMGVQNEIRIQDGLRVIVEKGLFPFTWGAQKICADSRNVILYAKRQIERWCASEAARDKFPQLGSWLDDHPHGPSPVDIIYGDTDSLMVHVLWINLSVDAYDAATMKVAMEFAHAAFDSCTDIFMMFGMKCVIFAYEKIYYPYFLVQKKHYAGRMYTNNPAVPSKTDAKAFDKRDFTGVLRRVLGCIKNLSLDCKIDALFTKLDDEFRAMGNDPALLNLADFSKSFGLKKISYEGVNKHGKSKPIPGFAQANDAMAIAFPGQQYKPGDRFSVVTVFDRDAHIRKETSLSSRCRTLKHVALANALLPPDAPRAFVIDSVQCIESLWEFIHKHLMILFTPPQLRELQRRVESYKSSARRACLKHCATTGAKSIQAMFAHQAVALPPKRVIMKPAICETELANDGLMANGANEDDKSLVLPQPLPHVFDNGWKGGKRGFSEMKSGSNDKARGKKVVRSDPPSKSIAEMFRSGGTNRLQQSRPEL